MSEWTRRLEDGWAHLESRSQGKSAPGQGWQFYDTGFGATERSFQLAVDEAGSQHLLVPCDRNDSFHVSTRSALRTTQRDFTFENGRSDSFLDVCCVADNLSKHFRTVVADVVERSVQSDNPARTAANVVTEWRLLFAEMADRKSLTLQRRMALFAELRSLLDIAEACGNLDMSWWTGPDLAPHDIEHPRFSVEVKAVGTEASTVQIHGVEQLETKGAKPLILAVRTIAESENGMTLPELALQVIERAENRSSARTKLFKAGITTERPGADNMRFEIVETFAIVVSDSTPRITASMIDGGINPAISSVRYDLDISALAGLADNTSITNIIGGLH